MTAITGRAREQTALARIFKSREAQFVAIYGRRRVGKTYLVKQFFAAQDCVFFHITGTRDGALAEQLLQFARVVEKTFYTQGIALQTPRNWMRAFELLTDTLEKQVPKGRAERSICPTKSGSPVFPKRRIAFQRVSQSLCLAVRRGRRTRGVDSPNSLKEKRRLTGKAVLGGRTSESTPSGAGGSRVHRAFQALWLS
jgi:hypothetical protein